MLFYPSSETIIDPAQHGFPPKEVTFPSSDGTQLKGWFFRSRTQPVRGTVIQFHGNAGNMTGHFQSTVWLIDHGYHSFSFDYRGYGKSEGEPEIEGINQDALAAYKFIINLPAADNTPIILYGQSLGGIVLLKSLENYPERSRISAVIVEGTFLSYQEIARKKMNNICFTWPFQHLAYILFSDEYAATEAVKKVSPIPLLIIHGKKDPVIPFRFGREIFETANEPKTFWALENGRHIDAMFVDGGKHRQRLVDYLARFKQ